MTQKEYKALSIFEGGRDQSPKNFASKYFDDEEHRYLLTAESKTGGGYDVVIGKKAWRCAGVILSRLEKKGWLHSYTKQRIGPRGGIYEKLIYGLTEKGQRKLNKINKTSQ